MRILSILLIMFSCLLIGCSRSPETTKTIHFNQPISEEDKIVLVSRIRANSSYISRVLNDNATLTITGVGLPSNDEILNLLNRKGKLTATSSNGNTWVMNEGSVSSEVGYDDKQNVSINLSFNPSGTATLSKFTKENVNTIVTISLDEQELMVARVGQPITLGKVQISTTKTSKEALLIASIINSGFLRSTIKTESIR